MKTMNRTGLYLRAALLTVALALLVGTPALGIARDNHGKIIHSARKTGVPHLLGHPGGLRVDWASWLRRWWP
jgi:hypothetical protein